MDFKKDTIGHGSVAIIGMACFFPKSPGLKAYHRLIFRGQDAISEVPVTHWSVDDYFDPDTNKTDHVYCKRGGFLDLIPFDPMEFGIPPAILDATDSSQLLALVAAKAALEDAGYGENRLFEREKVSVILGVTGTQELVIPLSSRLGHPIWRKALQDAGIDADTSEKVVQNISNAYVGWKESSFPGLLGNVVAGRISNRLDLGGTNCVVDAACASSLSAVHMAVMELLAGRNDMVITGGVDTLNDIFMHMCFSKTSVLSPTGDARPFSKDADGTVLGEGIGMLVLKRLQDAVNDNDRVYAVIKGIGSSSDGKSQSIYAPRSEGQVKALKTAYQVSGVEPETVTLIEAHGTGTPVGDEVEFKALNHFLTHIASSKKKSCALGSVKSMIGHTKAAAGSAGLIKTVLALYHKVLPPTLKVKAPDPNLNIDDSPLYLNTETRPWFSSQEKHPRRAGVSSFGFGGSNFHAVLEEYMPVKNKISWDGSIEILAFSGPTTEALIKAATQAKASMHDAKSFKEIAALASAGRAVFSHRDAFRLLMVIEQSTWKSGGSADFYKRFDEILENLQQTPRSAMIDSKTAFCGGPAEPGKIAFVFPGQGAQYVGMGKDLVCAFPQAFDILERADAIYGKERRLSDFIYPVPTFDAMGKKEQEARLTQTDTAQPAIGSVSLAMLKILDYFGLGPDATCGHSYGELTALNAAGWIDDDTLLKLSVHRGRLMAAAGKSGDKDPGTMMAVKAPLEELDQLIKNSDTGVILANRNNPTQGVLSGPTESIVKAEKLCKENGFKTIRLTVAAAFHSHLMKDAQKPFMEIVAKSEMTPTDIPVYSNTLGSPYPVETNQAKTILGKQILCPVDFVNDIKKMADFGIKTFVEVGPKTVLTGLVKAIATAPDIVVIPLDESGGKQSGMLDLAKTLCRLAALGYPVLLNRWEGGNEPTEPGKKPKMEVMISGANYLGNVKSAAGSGFSAKPPLRSAAEKFDFASMALKTVQEGLKSMQSLQKQTAETHQKFLESQMASNKALQAMVESTQRLIESSLGISPCPNALFSEKSIIPPIQEKSSVPSKESSVHMVFPAETGAQECPVSSSHPQPPVKPAIANEIRSVLLTTVSELTGYPMEMLGLDMDIEADLGIDSIKRVEILSAMEEKIPGLPQVLPEMMGTMKTLNQIIAYLSSDTCGIDKQRISLSFKGITNNQKADDIADVLLTTVSELTGYPVEMLGLDMDIEADLGIDSIKRVEILSVMEEKMPGLPQVEPEMMGTLKTLNQIIGFLSCANSDKPVPMVKTSPCIDRRIISPISEPFAPSTFVSLSSQKTVYVSKDFSGLSSAIASEFISRNIHVALIEPDVLKNDKFFENAAGLILLPPVKPPSEPIHWDQNQAAFLNEALMLAKKFGTELSESAGKGRSFFAAIMRLDGAFGFKGGPVADPMIGALGGLVKTAAIEWPEVFCRAFDISPDWKDLPSIAKSVVDELLGDQPTSSMEIGLNPDTRLILKAIHSPYPDGELRISQKDVVVVTGGARGITAQTALALAGQCKPALALLGRSPAPFEEPAWLKGKINPTEMKKSILEHEFSGKSIIPAILEKKYRHYAANREVACNLDEIRKTGAAVYYYSVDVCDKNHVSSIIKKIRQTHGPVSALIHGAGVREDRLIIDKTEEQFQRVFETKVKGLYNLLDAVEGDDLKYLVLFSSVAARMGNKGQSDYAMANEALNKIAQHQAFARPQCRVASINWGPWDGGMVTTPLKKEFIRNNISLIPLIAGAECLLAEMKGGLSQPAEVVIGTPIIEEKTSVKQTHKQDAPAVKLSFMNQKPGFSLAFEQDITLDDYPVLHSHRLNRIPVVPLAIMTEWFAHGALHENPGLYLHGIDDIRMLSGIKLDQKTRKIKLFISKIRKKASGFEVSLEIRNAIREETVHASAKAILTELPPEPPVFELPDFFNSNGYSRGIAEIYDQILFHGHDLQGIKEVSCLTDAGMVARILPAPSPKKWMKNPLRNNWVCDPLALDSAFQMASLWCFEKLGNVSLPVYAANYRQYRNHFPKLPITVVMKATHAKNQKMRGEFTFLDDSHGVIAQILGFEAVADETLNKAFKPQFERLDGSRLSA